MKNLLDTLKTPPGRDFMVQQAFHVLDASLVAMFLLIAWSMT